MLNIQFVLVSVFGAGGKQVLFFGSGGKQFLVLRTYLVYNTVVRLCQFFCCGEKVLLRPEKKVLVVCLAGCAVVSDFGSGGKQAVVLLWRESFITTGKKVLVICLAGCAVVSVESFITTGKIKFQSSVWQVVLLCQFLVLAGNRFWLYLLLCTCSTIQLWCCVSFFGSGGKQFLVLRTDLVYNTVVWLCHFFCCGGKVTQCTMFSCAVVSVFWLQWEIVHISST